MQTLRHMWPCTCARRGGRRQARSSGTMETVLVFALLVVPAALFGMSMSPAVTPTQRRNYRLVAAVTGVAWLGALVWQLQVALG